MSLIGPIAVVADDITGAADTGVQFCPVVGPIDLVGVMEGKIDPGDLQTAGVALFTDSRHLDGKSAAARVRRAIDKLRPLAPGLVYKKIDSCLRGNLGAEIDALLHARVAAASFIAPAYPALKRTTVDGIHRIDGVPVDQTEIGRDPLCPVRDSHLASLLARQSRMPVGHVDLACIQNGAAALARRVDTLIDRGVRHITFDVKHDADLDAIAALAHEYPQPILPVGSAGLAGSLARIMGGDHPLVTTAGRPGIDKWLFVCGSASRVLAQQAARLARATGWAHRQLDPAALIKGDGLNRLASDLTVGWKAGSLILSIQSIADRGLVDRPERVVGGLAGAVAALLAADAPQGLFLSGGETARAVWQRTGASALRIREEILPGLMRGEFVGGGYDGLPVVTKAGAFGSAEALNQLINLLK